MATTPPQHHGKGRRQALDREWVRYLTEGGDPGTGQAIRNLPRFQRGITEFNQRQFFQSHESFEAAWLEAPYPDRLLGLGLAKLAAAHVTAQRHGQQRIDLSTKLAVDTTLLLASLPATYAGLDIAALRAAFGESPIALPNTALQINVKS